MEGQTENSEIPPPIDVRTPKSRRSTRSSRSSRSKRAESERIRLLAEIEKLRIQKEIVELETQLRTTILDEDYDEDDDDYIDDELCTLPNLSAMRTSQWVGNHSGRPDDDIEFRRSGGRNHDGLGGGQPNHTTLRNAEDPGENVETNGAADRRPPTKDESSFAPPPPERRTERRTTQDRLFKLPDASQLFTPRRDFPTTEQRQTTKPIKIDPQESFIHPTPTGHDVKPSRPTQLDYEQTRPTRLDYQQLRPTRMDYREYTTPTRLDYQQTRPTQIDQQQTRPTRSDFYQKESSRDPQYRAEPEQLNSNPYKTERQNSSAFNHARRSQSWIDQAVQQPSLAQAPNVSNNLPNFSGLVMMPTLSMDILSAAPSDRTFNGNPLKWFDWSMTFKSLVHDNVHLSLSQKLTALRNMLGEEPRSHVYGLLWSEDTYLEALQELQRVYGNRWKIGEAYSAWIRKFGPVKSFEDVAKYDRAVKKLIQIYRALNFHTDLSSQALLSELVSKLSDPMRRAWGKHISRHGDPTVEQFGRFLSAESEALRYGGILENTWSKDTTSTNLVELETHQITSGTSASGNRDPTPYPTPEVGNSGVRFTCVFCHASNHYLNKCTVLLQKSDKERLEWFRSEGRCFLCGRKGHRTPKCLSRATCQVPECSRRHHAVLHGAFTTETRSANPVAVESETETEVGTSEVADNQVSTDPVTIFQEAVAVKHSKTFLKIVPCRVYSPHGDQELCYALIDDGSQACLIDATFAASLGLKGPERDLCLKNCARDVGRFRSKRVKFSVGNPSDSLSPQLSIREAWTMERLELPGQVIPRDDSGSPIWPHVNDLSISDVDPTQIKLLIGASCKQAFHQSQIRRGPPGQPDAVLTPFGWTLFGDVQNPSVGDPERPSALHVAETEQETELTDLVRRFWSTEDFGCMYTDKNPLSIEDRKSLSRLDSETILRPDGHYQVPMLWRDEHPRLDNNFRAQALPRWYSLVKRLKREPNLATQYLAAVNKYLEKGYGRELTPAEAEIETDLTHYMVHFAVFHPQKQKARVVFDNALKYRGESLNDKLMTGPQLVNSLPGILMRFRIGAVAVTADCADMFCCVFTPDTDSDALRFLFNENLDEPPKTFKMLTHVFGSACSPTCAMYALRRAAVDNAARFHPASVHAIMTDTYVDDFLHSTGSEEEAVRLARDAANIAKAGGFTLTKWVSNSPAVLQAIRQVDGVSTEVDLDLAVQPVSRVLGVRWKVKDDVFYFNIQPTPNDEPVTKRKLLSIVSSIFDPLGFLGPFIIRARLLFQKLWELKLEWDEPLSSELLKEWHAWLSDLAGLEHFHVNRQLWHPNFLPMQLSLHVFGDSSEKAFAACCYLRGENSRGEGQSALVAARVKVAPVGKHMLTLPRLELQAAVLATRLGRDVTTELQKRVVLAETTYWTDSVTVLRYIRNESTRFKTFVANRVAEVRSATDPFQWRHCPTDHNPADLATRGLQAEDLMAGPWLSGPAFLTQPETAWPPSLPTSDLTPEDPEVRNKQITNVAHVSALSSDPSERPAISPEQFSSWGRLTSVTARISRYMYNLRNVRTPNFDQFLSQAEICNARNYWLRRAQAEVYAPEISAARDGHPIPSRSPLLKLRPFLCPRSGLLRVGGRLAQANIPSDMKHQIIIPPKHAVSRLLARDCHERLLHAGVEHVVSQSRQAFWIPHVRPLVKQVIHECPTCRRLFTQPQVPRMSDLPPARLGDEKSVWYHTGVDVFGPYYVKQRRSQVKRWMIIYVSLSIKAVHFEILHSMSTDSMLCSFIRFFYRRGKSVRHLYSDAGSNFIGADRTLRGVLKSLDTDEPFRNRLQGEGVDWHFNPPKAAHMGGAWEIQIKSAKRSLRVILKDRSVHEEVLLTAMCQVEHIMNSRPLSYVGDDPEYPQALTANHFLNVATKIDTSSSFDLLKPECSRKLWKQALALSQQLWQRWRKEILPASTLAHKWHTERRNLTVGDVVVIVDSSAPRGLWPLGRVVEVHPGRDGRIRSARLKTRAGFLIRPASQMCLLESADGPNLTS